MIRTLLAGAAFVAVASTAQAEIYFEINPYSGDVKLVNTEGDLQIDAYDLQITDPTTGTFDTTVFVRTIEPVPGVIVKLGPLNQSNPNATESLIGELNTTETFLLPGGETSFGEGLFIPTDSTSVAASDFDATVLVGTSNILGAGAIRIVPEPASLALLGLGGLALVARRRSA